MTSGRLVRRLAPGQIAEWLYGVDPDRDERAPQICAEVLLTLLMNDYGAPESVDQLRSPKRQRFALRSLALGVNFLNGRDTGRVGDDNTTPNVYGDALAMGAQIRGSAHLNLAQDTLQGLVDPDTQRGQKGAWLLRPFHESLLWYDARRAGPNTEEYSVRKVYMRGSGITLARLLVDPLDPESRSFGLDAVMAIKDALTSPSPLATIAERLEAALPTGAVYNSSPPTEDDERAAWEKGSDPRLAQLSDRLCRYARSIMRQGGASGPAKLWQLRNLLALELSLHVLRTAWHTTQVDDADRFLVVCLDKSPRPVNVLRQRSEDAYKRARIRLSEATVSALATRMGELSEQSTTDWTSEFEPRSGLTGSEPDSVVSRLRAYKEPPSDGFVSMARMIVENADYGRAEEGFRVLLESVGLLTGASSYRYTTATPELLATLVGAMSDRMPMSSSEFFRAVRREWGLVINQESSQGTRLADTVDGIVLERNGRLAERLMSEAGLAISLSDRTTMVGERSAWSPW